MAGKMLSDAFEETEAIFSGSAAGKRTSLYDPIQRLFEVPLEDRFFVRKLLVFTEALELLMRCASPERTPALVPRNGVGAVCQELLR